MKGFIFDLEFMWGFQARVVGMSKTSPSFPLPPPTTVLGAIAEAYARRKGFSEGRASTLSELAREILALGYKPLNAITLQFQDVNRIVSVRTSSGVRYPSVKDPYGSFDAPARGKTLTSSLDEKPPTMRVFAVVKDTLDIISDDIWRVKRLGSKESMVSVVEVIEGVPEVISEGEVETDYSLLLTPELESSIVDREGNFIELEFVPITSLVSGDSPARLYLNYKVVRHLIPVPLVRRGRLIVKLPPGYAGYKINNEVVIGLSE
jgi:CRISPR-associated protein Cas5a/b/c